MPVLVRVSVVVKGHRDHNNAYEGKHLVGVSYSLEVQSIIIMVGHSFVQAGMMLEE